MTDDNKQNSFLGNKAELLQPVIYQREEHSISRKQIDPDALKIMYRLIRNGYKAYIVGGGVRDLLLEKTPKDFDIATDATPRRIKALFSNSRIIGRRFKLVHIFFGGGKTIEVSTFRDFSDPIDIAEVTSDGLKEDTFDRNSKNGSRPTDNKYGTEVTDALRRDLTINGLFYDLATFSIIDYVGGVKDLADGVIKVIGDPFERFAEDPVRMIRAVRHAAKTGFKIDERCRAAISDKRALIRTAAPMRVFEEIKKDLVSGHLLNILRLLAKTELLEFLMPELLQGYPALFDQNSFFSKSLKKIDELCCSNLDVSTTVVLSILALAMADATLPASSSAARLALGASVLTRFADSQEFLKLIERCFSELAVPRREREKINALLLACFHYQRDLQALTSGEPALGLEWRSGWAATREAEPELKQLLGLLEINDELLHSMPALQESNRRRQRSRRGGRNRRRRRN